jgi:DNA primase
MFPICNDTGEVLVFGRILEAEAKAAKYVNSPETILFTKGAVLFGLHRSKRALIEKNSAIVCEGQLDLITAFESGVQNVIAPQGTAFTPNKPGFCGDMLKRLCFVSIRTPRVKKRRNGPFPRCYKNSQFESIRMPRGQDPDSLIRTEGAKAFRALVAGAPKFFNFSYGPLRKAPIFRLPGRAPATRKMGDFISHITDPMLHQCKPNKWQRRSIFGATDVSTVVKEAADRNRASVANQHFEEARSGAGGSGGGIRRDAAIDRVSVGAFPRGPGLVAEEDWQGRLEAEPNAGPLIPILEGATSLENNGGVAAFLATLDAATEALVTTLSE